MLLDSFSNGSSSEILRQYVSGLVQAITVIKEAGGCVDKKCIEIKRLLEKKKIMQYVNIACELSVASYFAKKYPRSFKYQVDTITGEKARPDKQNFDFQFSDEKRIVNVEVKSFSRKENKNPLPIKIFAPENTRRFMKENGMPFEANCMPTMKRFLDAANSQLPESRDGLNVVVLCCNDPDEYADALECLVGQNGVLQSSPGSLGKLAPVLGDLPNIQAIVICNLGFSHLGVLDTDKVKCIYKDQINEFRNGIVGWHYNANIPVGVYTDRNKNSDFFLINDLVKTFELLNGMWNKSYTTTQDFAFDIFSTVQSELLLMNYDDCIKVLTKRS